MKNTMRRVFASVLAVVGLTAFGAGAEGLQTVKWLESTGDQWIDTEINADGKLSVEIKCQYVTESSGDQLLFGAISDSSGTKLRHHLGKTPGFFLAFVGAGDDCKSPFDPGSGSEYGIHTHFVDATQGTYSIDGGVANKISEFDAATDCSANYYLFGLNAVNYSKLGNVQSGTVRLCYAKFWREGAFVGYFVPAIDDKGVACLYDYVSKRPFYDASGSGVPFRVPETQTETSGRELPVGFVELDYVESVGNQPVITKYIPKGNTKIKAKLELTRTDVAQTVFCARGTVSSDRSFAMFWITPNGLRWDYGRENAYRGVYDSAGISTGDPFDLDIHGNEVYVNGSKSSKLSFDAQSDFQTDNPLVLFAAYTAEKGKLDKTTAFTYQGNVRLYSLTATEGEEVVLDLVPCQNQYGVAGLYDMVSGSFLSSCNSNSPLRPGSSIADLTMLTIDSDRDGLLCSSGVGTLDVSVGVQMAIKAEPSVGTSREIVTPIGWELTATPLSGVPYTVESNESNARCCTFTPQPGEMYSLKWHCARTRHDDTLPSGYTRLDSVKATGSQCLVTDYTPTGKTGVDLVMRLDQTVNQCVFCARGADSSRKSFSLMAFKGCLRWDYGAENANEDVRDSQTAGNGDLGVSIRGNLLFDGSRRSVVSKPNAADYTAGNRLVFFAAYSTDRPQEPTGFSSYAKMDLFLCRVLEDGRLVRQYLPCRRESDGAVGLYETVTGTFLVSSGDPLVAGGSLNERTTRMFIDNHARAGEDELPADYAGIDFVEATGSQYVVTDYTPNGSCAVSAKLDVLDSGDAGIYCARGADGVKPYSLFYYTQGFRWDYSGDNRWDVAYATPGVFELQSEGSDFYVNGEKSAVLSRTRPVDFTAGNRLVLFAAYKTSSPAEPTGFSFLAKVRLYAFAVAEGDSLKLNLLPCRRISDGTVGLYDAVGKKFYRSSSGTPLETRGTLTVVGKGGELGEPTLPYGVSTELKAGDSIVCSVPDKVEVDGGKIYCLGYALETNDVGGAWIPWKRGGGNSFVYEHPKDTSARLTWKWGKRGSIVFFK